MKINKAFYLKKNPMVMESLFLFHLRIMLTLIRIFYLFNCFIINY